MSEPIYMKRCLELALLGLGRVSPNPLVGAVVVHGDRIIGQGWHRQHGGPHAEVEAVRAVEQAGLGALLPESTLYVNLEPCSHHGKTPPCTELILDRKIPRVIVATVDPFEKVAGSGIAQLRAAGVEVEVGMLEDEARRLNRRFFTFHQKKRPYVVLKWAQTADGFMDALRPASVPAAWMTGEACRTLVHRWRTEEDSILVGRGTAQMDNPSLTARAWPGRNPLRVAVDPNLSLSANLKLFNGEAPTLVLVAEGMQLEAMSKLGGRNVEVAGIPLGSRVDDLLESLYERCVQSVMVEGGASLLRSFIEADCWDEARIFTAPVMVDELYPAIPFTGGVAAPRIPHRGAVRTANPALGLEVLLRD